MMHTCPPRNPGRFLPALLLAVLSAGALSSQSNPDRIVPGFDGSVKKLMKEYGVPGASIAYLEAGEIRFAAGYGSTRSVFGSPVNADTVFQAGSIGKPVAAYIVLSLAGEGKIDLDGPAEGYLTRPWPDEHGWASEITVRHLLTHTSGLSNSLLPFDPKVRFRPGSGFGYSGVGYTYLTKIVEGVTGTGFNEAAAAYVFAPLDMRSSSFDLPFMMTGNAAIPSMELRTFLVLCLVPFVLLLALTNLAGLVAGRTTKNRLFSGRSFFRVSYLASFALELAAAGFLMPKLIPPMTAAWIAFTALLFVSRLIFRRAPLAAWLLTFGVCLASALFVPLPVPADITPPGTNAAYSLLTTAPDLGRFGLRLLSADRDGRPIGDLLSEQAAVNERTSWGAGIGIEKTADGLTYWHSGINPGATSLLVLAPDGMRGVAVLTNSGGGLGFAKKVAELALGIRGTWEFR